MDSTPRRPSLVNRTLSTPPTTPDSNLLDTATHGATKRLSGRPNVLTPPTSPRQSRSSSDLSEIASPVPASRSLARNGALNLRGEILEPLDTKLSNRILSQCPSTQEPETTDILECPFCIEVITDSHCRPITYGHGAWSTVYKATVRAKTTQLGSKIDLRTPPVSPQSPSPLLIAVKKPARKDANAILTAEAKILTHLSRIPGYNKYAVQFYGIVDTSLVMEALPYSLESHILACAQTAASSLTTSNMTHPIMGSEYAWLDLAQSLITALQWLHSTAHVVHGDIKPGNILLSSISGEGESMTFVPVFADFSSSQRTDKLEITPNTLSAITREYTAPELLVSSVLKDPQSSATEASDVFSLAVTLLVAATGNIRVYQGSVWQRQAMATQGWHVIENVQNGEGGMRIPKKGAVEKVIEPAVRKEGRGRITSGEWLNFVKKLVGECVKL